MEKTIVVETDDNFESCDDCINCDDTMEICKKRGCIHAIDTGDIRECYKPKERKIILDKVKKVRDELQKLVDMCDDDSLADLNTKSGLGLALDKIDELIAESEKQ